MSNIGSIGSGGYAMMPQRPDPAKMTDALFAKLDTTGKGYLEKSDLQSALKQTSGESTAAADAVFAKLDSNNDGKLSKNEVSDGIKKLADALGNQLHQTRMGQGQPAGKGGPPPPPNKSASSSASSSSTSSNTSTDPADTDGTVSAQEALAYADKKSATAETSSSGSSTSLTASSQAGKSLKQIMDMTSAYNTKNTSFSVSA